jgi:hypothetical protein
MLRWAGRAMLALGVVVGSGIGLAILVGFHAAGLSWLIAVGLAKLGLVSAVGLMAGGAVCLRLDRRARERQLASLPASRARD